MKKVLLTLLVVILLAVLIAIPVTAATHAMTVVSDASVQVIGVYNKAGGSSNYVDLSGSPFNAKIAAEPKPYPTVYTQSVDDSTWDTGTGGYFQTTNPGADWIWETVLAEDPATVYTSSHPDLVDADASSNGRVVVFQKTFDITGTPTSATLNIAADNCYEVWINGQHVTRSATAKVDGWESTNLYERTGQDYVDSRDWGTVGHITVDPNILVNGTNTIKIVAGNEYYSPTDPLIEDNNDPCPPYLANPFRQRNPGAMIFKLDIGYEDTVVPPVPELPAGALLGIGLVGLVGFGWLGYRRSHPVKG
jgi:hypothetical protein